MVRLILHNCDIHPNHVNTVMPEVFDETPLYYAVQADHIETMNFLLERGGGPVMESVKLYHSSIYGYGRGRLLGTLFAFAIKGGYLKAAVVLYERSWRLVDPAFHSGNPGFVHTRSGSKEILDLVIGQGFNIEAAMELKMDEVQQLLLDEDSHKNAQDKTLFKGDTLLKNILIASDGHCITLENVVQWSDNKELLTTWLTCS
ncbi:unnamed protein product [Sphagnum troendelagicum]|uniref:Uncharacterized protein n=1 Tax=Sphagnum troendelagicum TaxID=128251 RepID=A0ABP0UHC8_9BRYO